MRKHPASNTHTTPDNPLTRRRGLSLSAKPGRADGCRRAWNAVTVPGRRHPPCALYKKEIKVANENNPPIYINLTGKPVLAGTGTGVGGAVLFDLGLRAVPVTTTSEDKKPDGEDGGMVTRTITTTVRNAPDPQDGVLYIVPQNEALLLAASGRTDFVYPDQEVELPAVFDKYNEHRGKSEQVKSYRYLTRPKWTA